MKNFKRRLFLTAWIICSCVLFTSCKKNKASKEEIAVLAVSNLVVEKTANAKELQVTWTYPSQAVSVEISSLLSGDNEESTIKRNILKSTGNDGSLLISLPEYGTYVITAVAIDSYENRSEKVTVTSAPIQENYDLKSFPAGADPKVMGLRLALRYIKTIDTQNPRVNYPYVCTWLGSFWFAKTIKDDQLYNKLLSRYNNIFFSSGSSSLYPSADHVDNNVFGAVPLEIYKSIKEKKYLDLGLDYANKQWQLPANATASQKNWYNQGYSWQTRIWIDDMFMITTIQAQAYQATGDRKYIDRTAKEMVMYLDQIQRPNGLFYHTASVPFFWGRGNGWMAVGMTEVLKILPQDSPYRKRIESAYKQMMKTLLQYQADDGMWRQLIDKKESWKETSGSAMFTYAMIVGVKKGWLDKITYGAAARKGWLALLTYINNDDNIKDVCEGTNAKNDYQYYIDRKRNTGDLHGQAPLLWCANALCSDM